MEKQQKEVEVVLHGRSVFTSAEIIAEANAAMAQRIADGWQVLSTEPMIGKTGMWGFTVTYWR